MSTMKNRFTNIILAATLTLGLGFTAQVNAEQRYYKPESGGYRLSIPAASQEIFHTTTGIRFVVGKNQLVSADIYSMPNFISVPLRQYSEDQKKDLTSFLQKTLDFSDFTFIPQAVTAKPALVDRKTGTTAVQQEKPQGSLKNRLETIRAAQTAADTTAKTETAQVKSGKDAKPVTASLQFGADADVSFALQAPKDSTLNRKFITGRAYQLLNDKILVVTVASPEAEKNIAQQGLQAVTSDLKIGKPHYPDTNVLTSNLLGMSLELPAGWHGYTLKADNIVFARSLSSVHEDNAMIRAFKTNEFSELANATSANLNEAEQAFVDKITKYTPNVSVVKHEPVVIDGLNGSIIQFTDSDDLKKVFVVNTYLFVPEGIGYQLRFNTDDTINYDLKMQAFTEAVKSFKRLQVKGKVQQPTAKLPQSSRIQTTREQKQAAQTATANQSSKAKTVNKVVKPSKTK